MRHHLFLKLWLVDTWFFADWRHHRAVTHLENVRQWNIRRGKKLVSNCHINTLIFLTSLAEVYRYLAIQTLLKKYVKFTGRHLCWSVFFNKVAGIQSPVFNFLIEKETPAQVFSSKFFEVFKNIFFIERLYLTA